MADSTDTTAADSPDLMASTGVNDINSPWNGLLQTALNSGVQIGGNALQAALAGQTPVKAPSSSAPGQSGSPAAAATVQAKSMLPWILGGLVVIVLGWLLLRK